MASVNVSTQNKQSQGQQTSSPLDNLTYDLVTMLHKKCKAMEAYDQYIQDAKGNQQVSQLIEQIRQSDAQQIEQLRQVLAGMLGGSGQTSSQGQAGGFGH